MTAPVNFIISANGDNLHNALRELTVPTGTIEAEYGDRAVEGSVFTMAHHGSRAHSKAPCAYENEELRLPGGAPFQGTVGLSHLDPDAVGGALAVLEQKPQDSAFWKLVEFYDLNGLHKVGEKEAPPETIRALYAQLAYFGTNEVRAPQDGSVKDVTPEVVRAANATVKIVAERDPTLLRNGDDFREGQDRLNNSSFLRFDNGVILRRSPSKCNHLYRTPDGTPALAVVRYDDHKGTVTLSFAEKPKAKNAIAIMESILPGVDGDAPGGHATIAGSRRNGRYGFEAALAVYAAVQEELR